MHIQRIERRLKLAGLAIAAVLCLVLARCAFGVELTKDELEAGLRDAAKYSRYELPTRMPVIRFVSIDKINANVHRYLNQPSCGYYDHKTDTHFFNDALHQMPKLHRHVCLMHEFTHMLQARAGRRFESCMDRLLLEAEAYGAQNKYLTERGHKPVYFSARLYPCKPGERVQ